MKRRALGIFTALALAISLLPAVAVADEGACGTDFIPIYDIQGDSWESPYHGETVTTEGVVTVDLQRSSEIQGFFLQDADGDGDPATSDGVFVYAQDTWGFDVAVGDHIRITADVDENYGDTELEWVSAVTQCGSDSVDATRLSVRDIRANAEAFEGMYVTFRGSLHVTDTYNLHRYGEVWLGDDSVIEQPTNEFAGGTAAMDALAADNMDQSILLDDGSRYSNPSPVPFIHDNGTLRVGDKVQNLTGAIHYSFSQYRVQPQGELDFIAKNKRPKNIGVDGDVVVGSFNVLNYWTTLGGRGAFTAEQLAVQEAKLVAAILGMNADIVALQEIENDPECGDGDALTICDHTPTETLVAALNAELGADVWSWTGPANHYNMYPIRNEIIFRNDRVSQVGDPMALADPAFDTFKDSGADSQLGRPPVAQTFSVDGETFTVMVNHFKSKGSSCTVIGDPDVGDGQGNCNLTRVAQAEAVLGFVDALIAASGDEDVLVVGDLNSYFREDPVLTLETELTNVLGMYDEDPYSYDFFATFAFPYVGRGAIDHALATGSMAGQVTDAKVWHINADEPRFLDWFDPSVTAPGPYRSSDHDPVVIGLTLGD